MAKKKKTGVRRRRVGAVLNPSNKLIKLGAVAVGFLAAKPVNEQIDKVVKGKINNTILGAGQGGLGALLLLSGRPNMIKTVVGGVAAGSGLKRLIDAMKTTTTPPPATTAGIGAYRNVPVIGNYRSVPVIGNGGRTPGYSAGGAVGSYAIRSGRVMGGLDGSGLIN